MRVLVTGASGNLGAYLVDALMETGHEVIAASHSRRGERSGRALVPMDLMIEPAAIHDGLNRLDPAAIIHAAAISSAEAVRRDPAGADRLNVAATRTLARWCSERGRRLIFTSTDLVFDGSHAPYRETDSARPVLAYGASKLRAEQAIQDLPGVVVARLSLLYGPSRCGRPAFFDSLWADLRNGKPITCFEDEFRTPLDYHSAASTLVELIETDVQGIVHVGGDERLSRHQLMHRLARVWSLDASLVRPNRRADAPWAEPRPADVSLDNTQLHEILTDWVAPCVETAAGGFDASPRCV